MLIYGLLVVALLVCLALHGLYGDLRSGAGERHRVGPRGPARAEAPIEWWTRFVMRVLVAVGGLAWMAYEVVKQYG